MVEAHRSDLLNLSLEQISFFVIGVNLTFSLSAFLCAFPHIPCTMILSKRKMVLAFDKGGDRDNAWIEKRNLA